MVFPQFPASRYNTSPSDQYELRWVKTLDRDQYVCGGHVVVIYNNPDATENSRESQGLERMKRIHFVYLPVGDLVYNHEYNNERILI